MSVARPTFALLVATLSLACAGPQRPWPSPTLCSAGLPEATPGADAMLKLLLSGWDPETRRTTTPPLDCGNSQVRWPSSALACRDGSLANQTLSNRPLGPDDVVISPAGEKAWLVWVMTGQFASGDAVGVVAAVEEHTRRAEVKAIGTLRAYPSHARLRMERIGTLDVLVAEGDLCTSGGKQSCTRAARILELRGDRFQPLTLFDTGGGCSSPGWVELAREEVVRMDSGSHRRSELTGSLVFEKGTLRIDELVIVQDLGPKPGARPPRLLHRAQASRTVTEINGRLRVSDRSLWDRVRAD